MTESGTRRRSRAYQTFYWILSRYDGNSLRALLLMGALYTTMFVLYGHMLDWSRGMDWLLSGIWSFMTLTLLWNIVPARDARIAFVAFFGGLIIEWWGTTTGLWHYYTAERPPPWILPAWPVAALAIERIAMVVDRLLPRSRLLPLCWIALPVFVAAMTRFLWPSIEILSSRVVVGLMLGALLTARDLRRDLTLFVAGSCLGIFLEYWGTSRLCWTYYTEEIPPVEAIFAHGFASIAFARGISALNFFLGRLGVSPVPRMDVA